MSRIELLKIAACLTVSNFIFQAFTHHNYDVAFERSFFQGTAILLVWFVGALKKKTEAA
jgi:hypothetical protein